MILRHSREGSLCRAPWPPSALSRCWSGSPDLSMYEFDGGVSLFGVERIANFGLFETAIYHGENAFQKAHILQLELEAQVMNSRCQLADS